MTSKCWFQIRMEIPAIPQRLTRTINTTLDPDVTVLITSGTITSIKSTWVGLHISLEITLMVLPNGTGNGRPRGLEDESALDMITSEFLAGDGVKNGRLNTKERYGSRTGLGLDSTGEGGDDDGTRLGLP